MQYRITAPGRLDATIKLPASKSISNRALVIHALSGGGIMPENLSDCDDTNVIIRALRDNPYDIDIKAAGTAMRFMTALLSVRSGEEHILTGTERMKQRPIAVLVDALRHLGADISYTGTITLGGDVNIILCDGKTMTVSEDDNTIYGESKALHIYGQS